MLVLLTLVAQDYILRDQQTSAVAAYGPYELEREDCVERSPPVAVLHYAHCVSKVRLRWSSEDGRVFILYEDNGALLFRTFSYPTRPKMPGSCRLGGIYAAYQARSATNADWQKNGKAFGATLTRCSSLTPSQIASYQAEFASAASYYSQAASGLRSLAIAMFTNLRRCTEQKWNSRAGGRTICTREEGPASSER
ncbi:hypothetical protein ACVWZA_000491 [Sphingomonas sp. UYAg733]